MVVKPGVSVVASQFTNVTTLWAGSSKVKSPLVRVTGLLATRLSLGSGEVTHGVSVSIVLPLTMNFWFTVLVLVLMFFLFLCLFHFHYLR